MTEIVIEFNDDRPFTHVMIVPKQLTFQNLIHRLQLTPIWRYIFMCKKKNKMVELINETNRNTVEPCKITIFKSNFSPILFYKNNEEMEYYKDYKEYNNIVIWFNYISSEIEPIYIYLLYKIENSNEWHEYILSAINFEQVDHAIKNNAFLTTKIARERLAELKENL
jgi:hypothetical protein